MNVLAAHYCLSGQGIPVPGYRSLLLVAAEVENNNRILTHHHGGVNHWWITFLLHAAEELSHIYIFILLPRP